MFKNMKIRKSLILGFGISILASILMIVVSLIMMNSMSRGYQRVIENEIEANQLITDIRLDANIAARNLRELALLPNSPSAAEMEAQAREVVSEMDVYLNQMKDVWPLDQSSLDSYIAAVHDWTEEVPQILDAIDRNDINAATSLVANNCTPALNKLASLGKELDSTLTAKQVEAVAKQERSVMIAIILMLVLMVVMGVIVMVIATKLIRSIVEPTEQVRKALVGFSEGNLSIHTDYESKNELGEMCQALRTSQSVLAEAISDTCRLLEEMGRGNFDVRTKGDHLYVGDLSAILKSVRTINRNLSDTLTQIDLSAEQVSSGAEQVSTGAQALAQGATEQASAVEELSATIADISNNAQKNARRSEEAMGHSKNSDLRVRESAEYMDQMVKAMEKISESSTEIGKIIATIENIAFQTNILALNAAVEAARAGSAGKGFAVVADEVRNLATKSDQAAKATKELIDHSISSVQEGSDIVKQVSESLDKTVEATKLSMEAIQDITKAVEEESESIAQVTEGIDQISAVVQTNSATSEESAAASEELSSQAALMKTLMAKFKLRNFGGEPSYPAAQPAFTPDYSSAESAVDTASSYTGASPFSKY